MCATARRPRRRNLHHGRAQARCLARGLALAADATVTAALAAATAAPAAGGHAGVLAARGIFFKPLLGARGAAEAAFYARAARDAQLAALLPQFYGVVHREGGGAFLALADALGGARAPRALDVKLGAQTFAPDAPRAKVAAALLKARDAPALGFRVTGLVAHGAARRGADAPGAGGAPADAFVAFLRAGARVRTELVPPLLARLHDMLRWARGAQRDLTLYGASLLLSVDDAPGGGAPPAPRAHLIDFAHAWSARTGRRLRDEDEICAGGAAGGGAAGGAAGAAALPECGGGDGARGGGGDDDWVRGLANVVACLEHVAAVHGDAPERAPPLALAPPRPGWAPVVVDVEEVGGDGAMGD